MIVQVQVSFLLKTNEEDSVRRKSRKRKLVSGLAIRGNGRGTPPKVKKKGVIVRRERPIRGGRLIARKIERERGEGGSTMVWTGVIKMAIRGRERDQREKDGHEIETRERVKEIDQALQTQKTREKEQIRKIGAEVIDEGDQTQRVR